MSVAFRGHVAEKRAERTAFFFRGKKNVPFFGASEIPESHPSRRSRNSGRLERGF